jgi:hypothetical protein
MGQIVLLKQGKTAKRVKKTLNIEHPDYTVIILKKRRKNITRR